LADRLEKIGLGRTLATVIILGLAAVAVTTLVFLVAPLAAGQLSQFAQTLPGDLQRAQDSIEKWATAQLGERFPALRSGLDQALSELSRSSSSLMAGFSQNIIQNGLAAINLISLLLITPVVVFYLLKDWHRVIDRIDSWLPRDHVTTIRAIAHDIDRAVSAFIRGQGTICLILGVIYATALSLIGLRYGFVIGIVTGVFAFIPFVGWALGLATALLAALSQTWPETTMVLKVLGLYFGILGLDAAVLSPAIVGQRVGLHPVWLIFALLVFSALFGFVGTLIAVPVAAALAVVVRFARDRYLASSIYLGGHHDQPRANIAFQGPET
ncbi:MAG: AI-2E family transporter, partial [Hyphomicrobiaceae bacterium]